MADGSPVTGDNCIYGAAVANGNLYVVYRLDDNQVGLLEGVDQSDGSVVFKYLKKDATNRLILPILRHQGDFGRALPCMSFVGIGPSRSWPQVAVAPGSEPVLYIVYQDTATNDPNDRDVNVYLVKVTRSGGFWTAQDRVLVNNEHPLEDDDQFHPAVHVDSAGRIHVVYYDDRHYADQEEPPSACEPPCDTDLDAYWTYSADGGQTFPDKHERELCTDPPGCLTSPPVVDMSEFMNQQWNIGEHVGINSHGTRVFAAFHGMDSQDPARTVVWATRIEF